MPVNASMNSLKFRMTGAMVWLVFLIIVVPIWYGHPVHFSPESDQSLPESKQESVVAETPFVLPASPDHAQPASVLKQSAPSSVPSLNKSSVSSGIKTPSTSLSPDKQTKKGVASAVPTIKVHLNLSKTQSKSVEKPVASVSSKWIIRVAAYRSKEKANLLYEHLKYDYDVFVKFFPKSRYYSVRIGPYTNKNLAIKDQAELNRVLRVRSELTKIK